MQCVPVRRTLLVCLLYAILHFKWNYYNIYSARTTHTKALLSIWIASNNQLIDWSADYLFNELHSLFKCGTEWVNTAQQCNSTDSVLRTSSSHMLDQ